MEGAQTTANTIDFDDETASLLPAMPCGALAVISWAIPLVNQGTVALSNGLITNGLGCQLRIHDHVLKNVGDGSTGVGIRCHWYYLEHQQPL